MSAPFVADPFMIRKERRWYMFFEVMDAETGLGRIACAHRDDGLVWSPGSLS